MKRFVTLSRVVVTGRGAITPLGLDAKALWHGLVSGHSGISPIKHFDATDFPIKIAGYIHDFDPQNYMTRKQARRTARFTQLALAAAREAISDAALDLDAEDPTRIGVEIGCATGSIETIVGQQEIMREKGPRRLVPSTIIGGLINYVVGTMVKKTGLGASDRFFGAFFGFFVGICPACIGLIGLIFPLGTSLTLTYYSWIFMLVAIGIMLLSLYLLGGFKKDFT